MRITLPRADSKLDKEKETKKILKKKSVLWPFFISLFIILHNQVLGIR